MKQVLFPALAATILLASCSRANVQYEGIEDNRSLLKADSAASKMSVEKGIKASMLAFTNDSSVLLRPNHKPIKGVDIKAYMETEPDSLYTISWEPMKASVAASGELGYTYGIYTLRTKSDGSIQQGTYATVWRREKRGDWKIMLDTGNPGLEQKATDTTKTVVTSKAQ